uniref:Tubulin beta chain n=1 Tax=Culicoides sonorensis TaxID=179676 RepID=A0A336LVT1_CULSO
MREIIFMQIGHCGNKVGQKFWELVCNEHCLDYEGHYVGTTTIPRQRIDVYFDVGQKETYVPRSIFVDLEPGTLKGLQKAPYGNLFSPDAFLYGHNGAANNWAKGFYTEGAEMMDKILNLTRKRVENCDLIQGFQLVHSIGGGTGAGMGSLLARKLKDEYGSSIINTFSVVPSPKVSEVVVEPYSAILSLNELISSSDETVCLDNEALHDIAQKYVTSDCPKYSDLNHLIAHAMSGITTCFRFPGQLNTDLRKLKTNMIPFEKLHFFIPAIAPIPPHVFKRSCGNKTGKSISDITMQLFNPDYHMCQCDHRTGTYLTAAAIFRGRFSTKDIDEQMVRIQECPGNQFASWIPNNIKTAICNVPPPSVDMSATFLANSTAINVMLRRVLKQFDSMFDRKAYLHWYKGEGMDADEFQEARNNVQSLIDEYQQFDEPRGKMGKKFEDYFKSPRKSTQITVSKHESAVVSKE